MNDFLGQIYPWYSKNRRNLPWRETRDPYKIWISEIILQQTRVVQGINYYHRFIEKFPTVNDLANSTEDEVLKTWQGLGYYSRARNLYSTANFIVNELSGKFPENYTEILKLKGVGNYTAAAVASIAYDLPYPAIDGNIYRLFSRYFGIYTPVDTAKGKNEIFEIANEIMPGINTGFHNQALIEFGALQCIPKSAKCEICPLVQSCYAAQNNAVKLLPVKSKKTKQINRYFYYFYFDGGDFIFLEKRTSDDIWKNLFQFPLFESKNVLSEKEILMNEDLTSFFKFSGNIKSISPVKKHILSHQIISARIIHVELKTNNCLNEKYIQVNKKDIYKFAVPKLVEHFIKELDFE